MECIRYDYIVICSVELHDYLVKIFLFRSPALSIQWILFTFMFSMQRHLRPVSFAGCADSFFLNIIYFSLHILSHVFQMGREKVCKFYWVVNISRSIAIRKNVLRNVHTYKHRSMIHLKRPARQGGREREMQRAIERNKMQTKMFMVLVHECCECLKHSTVYVYLFVLLLREKEKRSQFWPLHLVCSEE